MLKKRKFGKQGLEVSELGLGLMGMSQSYGTRNDPESPTAGPRYSERQMAEIDR